MPEHVLVVDNHSADGTAEYLASASAADPSLVIVTAEENLGPAGGYAIGMTSALEQGEHDYLWVMDDDCFPDPNCLEAQLGYPQLDQAITVFPQLVDRKTSASFYTRNGWIGVLIPTPAVKAAGVPDKNLFFWSEDAEYLTWRLDRRHGVRRVLVPEAVVRFDRYHTNTEATWRDYYVARNRINYQLRVRASVPRVRRYAEVAVTIAKLGALALLGLPFQDDNPVSIWHGNRRKTRIRYFILGTLHGLAGRLGKTIDPAASERRETQ